MDRFCHRLGQATGGLLAALLGLLVLLAVADTALWALAGFSWAPAGEIQSILLTWLGLLGAAYAVEKRLHVGVELVVKRLPATLRRSAERAADAAVAVFGAALALYGVALVTAVDNRLPATGWPAAVQYLPAVVAGGLVALFATRQAFAAAGTPGEDRAGV